MMTSIVQESTTPTTTARVTSDIPPHFLIVGKKNALDYIAPALFRIGTFGELVVRAKGSMSIVTAVNVAEMVKKDIAGLETRSVSIGTEEIVIAGMPKRVSYIEIHLAKPAPQAAVAAEAPKATEEAPPQDKLAETASTAKKIRAKAKKSTTAKKKSVRKKADA